LVQQSNVTLSYLTLPSITLTLATTFLTHFYLPLQNDTRTDLLTSLEKSKLNHISDHIHQWRRKHQLVKVFIPDRILVKSFMNSLLTIITEDVAKGGVLMEG